MEAARRLVFQHPDPGRLTTDDLLEAAFPAFAREWGDYDPYEDTPKSFANTFQALAFYLTSHPPATDVVQPLRRPDGSPTVEYRFAIPLHAGPRHPITGDPFIFTGRFDLLGTYAGLPCVVDEKTTTSIGFSWSDQWKLRGQFMGYCWALQQDGYDLNTAVIRGIGILKTQYKVATQIEQYPQHLIERWYRQLIEDLKQITASYHVYKIAQMRQDKDITNAQFEGMVERAFPFNFADSCSSYGGCAYANLCLARDPADFIPTFSRYRWDPLARIPMKEVEP